jgi:Fe-S-cluster containining protein
MVTAMQKVPECLDCGTCCFSRLDDYVRVTGDDYSRLGDQAEALVWFDSNRAYLRMVNHHCVALIVDKAHQQFVCSIYETRPQVCRDLERGSPACRAEIETKGLRPISALTATA